MTDAYYRARFVHDRGRGPVWEEIAAYLQRFVPPGAVVVDIGAGYCDFINRIRAAERYAVDANPSLPEYAAPGVRTLIGKVPEALERFEDGSITTVFASNLLEHLEWPEIRRLSFQLRRILAEGGRWIIVQPNFRYSYRGYFDDYTHRTIFTDVSLADYLESEGFSVEFRRARFLPLSFHSRLPKSRFLARIYLRLPFRPLAGQMLMVARKEKNVEE